MPTGVHQELEDIGPLVGANYVVYLPGHDLLPQIAIRVKDALAAQQRASDRLARWLDRALGTMLIGLGLKLAAMRR